MIHHLYYNYKDLLKTPRVAIGPQRLFIATLGIFSAHAVWFFFHYLALYLSEYDIYRFWDQSGLLPFAFGHQLTTISTLLAWFGSILTVLIILYTNTAVSRAAYMYLRKNYYYTSKQAIHFAFRRSKSIISVYLTFLFLILPFIAGALLMAFIGDISGFGEIVNALATLPYIFSGMVLFFMTLCLIFSVFLSPAIIASSEEDGFGAAIQCMHLTWGQPWRLATYGLLAVVLFFAGIISFAFVVKLGLIIYSILFMPLMHSLAPILNNALYYLEISMSGLDGLIRQLLGENGSGIIYLKQHYLPEVLTTTQSIASYIIYFSFLLMGHMALGYGQGIVNSALTMSYIIFEVKLSDRNLLERKDSEIAEDQEAFEFNIKSNTKSLKDFLKKKE